MARKLKPIKRRTALAAIRRGSTIAAAAERAGVSSAIVSRWAKEESLELGSRKKPNKALRLLEKGGLSVSEIAQRSGVSRVTVYALKRKKVLNDIGQAMGK